MLIYMEKRKKKIIKTKKNSSGCRKLIRTIRNLTKIE